MVLNIYGHGSQIGQQTITIWINIYPIHLQINWRNLANLTRGFRGEFPSHLKCVFMWPWNKSQSFYINLKVDVFPYFWLIKYLCKYDTSAFNSSQKIDFSIFFPYKCIRKSIWPYQRKFKGQLQIINWMKLIGLKSPKLYTKFQGSQFLGSGAEDFQRFFTIYGLGGHLGQQTRTILTNCHVHKIKTVCVLNFIKMHTARLYAFDQYWINLWLIIKRIPT